MSKALLVVDVQDLMFSGKLVPPVAEHQSVLRKINWLIENARGQNQPVIFIQHDGAKGEFLEPGNPAWELFSDLKRIPSDPVFNKSEGNAFSNPELGAYFESHNIQDVVVVGCASEQCVAATTAGAIERGLNTVLVSDAHGTWGTQETPPDEMVAQQNELLGKAGASVQATKELVA